MNNKVPADELLAYIFITLLAIFVVLVAIFVRVMNL